MIRELLESLIRYNCVLRPRWTAVLQRDIGTRDLKTGEFYTEVPARAEAEEWGGVWNERIRGYVWTDFDQAWTYAEYRNDHMSMNSYCKIVRVY